MALALIYLRLATALLFLLFAGAFFLSTVGRSFVELVFPYVLMAVMVLVGLPLVAGEIRLLVQGPHGAAAPRSAGATDPAAPAAGAAASPDRIPGGVLGGIALLLLLGVYTFAIARLGFYLSSAVFFPLAAVMIGFRRQPWLLAALTILVTAASYVLFTVLLSVPLP